MSFRYSTVGGISVCVLPHFNTLKACNVTYLTKKGKGKNKVNFYVSSIFCRNPMLAKLQDAPNATPTPRLCANMSKRCMELTFMPQKDIKETSHNLIMNHNSNLNCNLLLSRPRIRSNHHQVPGEPILVRCIVPILLWRPAKMKLIPYPLVITMSAPPMIA